MPNSLNLDAHEIALLFPHEKPENLKGIVPQAQHRIDLIKIWGIQPGEHILEIGCGQGDCTITLAAATGEKGHVTAIDPAPSDYGAPYTLGQAQAHISDGPFGSRINFVQADPLAFLRSTSDSYTTAVLCHSIWYFATPSVLREILLALSTRVQKICIAEYALVATDSRASPHVLAALAQAFMECWRPSSNSNIRTVLSPSEITAAAVASGLIQQEGRTIVPNEGLLDGRWEVGAVLSDGFVRDIENYVKDEKEKAAILAMRYSVSAGRDAVLAKGRLRTMDVWVSIFTKQS